MSSLIAKAIGLSFNFHDSVMMKEAIEDGSGGRDLCLKFATENRTWGYARIQGALANVGYDIRSHLSDISVADFFTVGIGSLGGFVRCHVGTVVVMRPLRSSVLRGEIIEKGS